MAEEIQDDGPDVVVLNFADSKIPVFKETRNKDYIKYGEDNKYGDFLDTLYNKSAKHNAIVNGKVNYIFGNGYENGDVAINRMGDTLNDVVKRCILDKVSKGGYRLEIIWGINKKVAEVYHVEFNTLRKGKSGGFYFKEDWKSQEEEIYIPSFDPFNAVGSQIYDLNDFRPGVRYYPLPEYIGSINYIQTDIEISKYYLSAICNGMMPSKMVQMFEGNLTTEKKQKIEQRWKEKFTGAENAGKFILVFNNDKNKSAEVTDLSGSDLDKHFVELNKTTQQEIYAGHGVTSPMLFGIKTEGQLGGTSELQTAYSIFQNTYSKGKAKEIDRDINYLFKFSNFAGKYELKPSDPIGITFDVKDVISILPKAFVYEKLGVPKEMWGNETVDPAKAAQPAAEMKQDGVNDAVRSLTAKQHQQLVRIIRQYSKGQLTEPAARTLLKTGLGLSDEDINSILGIETAQFNEHDEIAIYDEYGDSRNDFEILRTKAAFSHETLEDEAIFIDAAFSVYDVTLTEDKIIELLKKDPLIKPETIATAIGETKSYVESKIKLLIKKGYIEQAQETIAGEVVNKLIVPKDIDIKVPPSKLSPTQIYVKYSYEGPEDSRNRPFCAKLMSLNRLYSRADIERLSERLGYSVFDRGGGFWNKNGITLPHCRHSWKANVVIKKGGKK